MNEEILKEAVNKGSYLSYHWRQYTFEQLEKEMRELCGLCLKAQKEIDKPVSQTLREVRGCSKGLDEESWEEILEHESFG